MAAMDRMPRSLQVLLAVVGGVIVLAVGGLIFVAASGNGEPQAPPPSASETAVREPPGQEPAPLPVPRQIADRTDPRRPKTAKESGQDRAERVVNLDPLPFEVEAPPDGFEITGRVIYGPEDRQTVVCEQFGTGGYRIIIDDGTHHTVRSHAPMETAVDVVYDLGLTEDQLTAVEATERPFKEEYENIMSSWYTQVSEAAGQLAEAIAAEDSDQTQKASMNMKTLMNRSEEQRRILINQYVDLVSPNLSPAQQKMIRSKLRR